MNQCKQCGNPVTQSKTLYCKECRSVYNKGNWKRTNKDHIRNYEYIRNFGITLSDYMEMEEKQGGLCAICRKPPSIKRLYVDHDHVTGKVRALLCYKCNTVLGAVEDKPERLMAFIEYIKTHSL